MLFTNFHQLGLGQIYILAPSVLISFPAAFGISIPFASQKDNHTKGQYLSVEAARTTCHLITLVPFLPEQKIQLKNYLI